MGCGSSTAAPTSSSATSSQPSTAHPAAAAPPSATHKQKAKGESTHQKADHSKSNVDPGKSGKPSSKKAKCSTDDRYDIVKVLGEGASCKVVSARDKQTQKMYAMKIMDKSEPYNKVRQKEKRVEHEIAWYRLVALADSLLHPLLRSSSFPLLTCFFSFQVLWENETLILKTLRHPNILEWIESYEDKKTYHLLTVTRHKQ